MRRIILTFLRNIVRSKRLLHNFRLIAFLILGSQVFVDSASAKQGCEPEIKLLKQKLGKIRISLATPKNMRVGKALTVNWTKTKRSVSASTPVYLIFSMPSYVRFEGSYSKINIKSDYGDTQRYIGPGFFALPEQAKAPFDISHAKNKLRVFVPIHHEPSITKRRFNIKIYRSGNFTLSWAVVAITRCGVQIVEKESSRSLQIELGKPQIVIHDFFTLERPKKSIISKSKQYRLNVYDGRYEVFRIDNNAKLIERNGWRPNFSPTSRFVSASTRADDDQDVEIIDLVSGKVVFRLQGPIVAWAKKDAFLIEGTWGHGGIVFRNSLVDTKFSLFDSRPEYRDNTTPVDEIHVDCDHKLCSSWDNFAFNMLLDQGLIYIKSSAPYVGPYLVCQIVDHQCKQFFDKVEAESWLKKHHAGVNTADPENWSIDGKIELSNYSRRYESSNKNKKKRPSKYLVRHINHPVKETEISLARYRSNIPGSSTLRGISEKLNTKKKSISKDQDPFAKRLKALGVKLVSPRQITSYRANRNLKNWKNIYQNFHRSIPEAANKLFMRKDIVDLAENSSEISDFSYSCGAVREDDDLDKLMKSSILGAWNWSIDKTNFWLLQTACFGGSSAMGESTIDFVFKNKGQMYQRKDLLKKYSFEVLEEAGKLDQSPFHITPGGPEGQLDKARVVLSVLSQKHLLFAIPLTAMAFVIDYKNNKLVGEFKRLEQAEKLKTLYLTQDFRFLVQLNDDGRFYLYGLKSGTLELSGRHIDDEIILFNTSNYYSATYEGAHFVHLRFNGLTDLHSFHQFKSTLERPDIIKSILSGKKNRIPDPNLVSPPILNAKIISSKQSDTSFQLSANARSEIGLKSLRIYKDGKFLHKESMNGLDGSVQTKIQITPETRWISVVAIDKRNFESKPEILPLQTTVGAKNAKGQLFVLSTGTDNYDHERLDNLSYASSDAQSFISTLKSQSSLYYRSVIAEPPLVNVKDLKSELQERLGRIVKKATELDTIMLLFAGHGIPGKQGEFYLADKDTDPDNLRNTATSWNDVASILKSAKARVIVFLDACHSGVAGGTATNDDAVSVLLKGARKSITVISASKGRQFSLEDSQIQGGAFTTFLTNTLSKSNRNIYDLNNNGVIELAELYGAMKRRVVKYTQGSQTPWIARNQMVGEIPLY